MAPPLTGRWRSATSASPTPSSARTGPGAAARRCCEDIDFEVRARRGGGPGRAERGGQEHHRPAGAAAVRPDRGRRARGRRGRAVAHPGVAAGPGERGPAGHRAAERDGRREHRLRDRRRHAPRTSRRRPGWRTPTTSSWRCPRGTRRRSGSAAPPCPAGSASGWPSPARSSGRRPILILDEPTTGLDRESADVVVGALRSLMRRARRRSSSRTTPRWSGCADRVLRWTVGRSLRGAPSPPATGARRTRRPRPHAGPR